MKNNSFAKRVASAIVLVAIILLAGIVGRELLLVLIFSAATVGLYELYKALSLWHGNLKTSPLFVLAMLCEVVFFIVVVLTRIAFLTADDGGVLKTTGLLSKIAYDADRMDKIQCISILAVVALFSILLLTFFMLVYVFTFPKYSFTDIAYAFTGFEYVVVFMSFVYLTRCLSNGKYEFWLIFISSWICDTFAYLVGCTIGKHKLAPVLSPKKSIEGSIGGIAGAVLVAFLFGYLIEHKMFGGSNHALVYMIICAFGAVVSQIGDLTASGIKRNHDIKDYGHLIPGHGGILDRFDSVIFVAPVIYLLSAFLL